VKVLIDTHTFLWMAAEPEKLPARARETCETAELVFSVASVWEIGIKWEMGRLPLPSPPREYIALQIRRGGVSMLAIHYRHALTAAGLPMLHKDPFDRMLAAQCIEEGLSCVTRDSSIAAYGVTTVWS
jgi:PIN domain nuclease of toxin-antitoxin system